MVLRNEHRLILGACTNRFQAENPFCAEAEAAVQALKVADELKLDKINIEGDAHNVIMAIRGFTEFEDWKTKKIMETGKALLFLDLFGF